MEPIQYIGPDEGIVSRLVDDLNDGIQRGWPTEKVLLIALNHLYGVVGQLEARIMEAEAGDMHELFPDEARLRFDQLVDEIDEGDDDSQN
jgi:hypothetical protein